jgi:hypothetical protein
MQRYCVASSLEKCNPVVSALTWLAATNTRETSAFKSCPVHVIWHLVVTEHHVAACTVQHHVVAISL